MNPKVAHEIAPSKEKLRPYQQRAVRNVTHAFRDGRRRVLLVEFMGSGKTVTAAELIRQEVGAGGRVLVLTNRGQILKQTLAKLLNAGLPAEMVGVIWSESLGMNVDAPIQVAMVQTLVRRSVQLVGCTLIVIDEAHHTPAGSWKKILAAYPEARLLGLTATPERLDGSPLGDFFDHMVSGELPEHLIADGYLVQPEIWTRPDGWLPEKVKKRGGDYDKNEAARAMSGSTIVGGIPLAYKKHGRGLPAVLFAATMNQATVLVDAFKRAGIRAETLFGNDSDRERDAKLARLSSGKTKVLCTCDVLGEGWDYAGCRVVIIARPTASLARYMQWCGRGMRPGKVSVILDHAGNFYMHGMPWQQRDWSLHAKLRRFRYGANIDSDGRVLSVLEPIEVVQKLVHVNEVVRQEVCAGFDRACPKKKKPPKYALSYSHRLRRNFALWRCLSCTARLNRVTTLQPDLIAEFQTKKSYEHFSDELLDALRWKRPINSLGSRKLSKHQRAKIWGESGRKANATMSLEQRSERARRGAATRLKTQTPEQRKLWLDNVRKWNVSRTPEQRSAAARKAAAARTPEQRSEIARRGRMTQLGRT